MFPLSLIFRIWLYALVLLVFNTTNGNAVDVRTNTAGPPIYLKATELTLTDNKDAWHGRYGAGIALTPDFAGSKDYTFNLDLDLKLFWKNTVFFENGTLGVIAFNNRIWRAGVLLRGVQGRRTADMPIPIKGLGKVSERLDGGIFLGASLYKTYLTAELFTDISGVTKGEIFNLEAGYTMELSRQARLVPYVRLKWGSTKHLQAFFGVNAQQATATGLAQFDARSSLYENAIGVVFENHLNENWRFSSSANLGLLNGAAADSPLTRSQFGDRGQVTLRAKLLKTF